MVYFGPAGNSDSFAAAGHKSTLDAPSYVASFGLNAYEYQCGNGVTVKEETAHRIGEAAVKYNVCLSLHAPYYISMSGEDDMKRLKSVDYLLQSAAAAKAMGAERIIYHPGGLGKLTREAALARSLDTLMLAIKALDEKGYSDIVLCPEVMGKINQLGTPEEVAEMCKLDERLVPCIDFGHFNARTHGTLLASEDYKRLLDIFVNAIGYDRMKHFHAHFSKIEYSKGGEVRHLTFEDEIYGPLFTPLAEVIVSHGYEPHIICESAGTQIEDARTMAEIYRKLSTGFAPDEQKEIL